MIINTGDVELKPVYDTCLSPELWSGVGAHHLRLALALSQSEPGVGKVYQVSHAVQDRDICGGLDGMIGRYVLPAVAELTNMIVNEHNGLGKSHESPEPIVATEGAQWATCRTPSFSFTCRVQYDTQFNGPRVIFVVTRWTTRKEVSANLSNLSK
jgi:hypothetical protein